MSVDNKPWILEHICIWGLIQPQSRGSPPHPHFWSGSRRLGSSIIQNSRSHSGTTSTARDLPRKPLHWQGDRDATAECSRDERGEGRTCADGAELTTKTVNAHQSRKFFWAGALPGKLPQGSRDPYRTDTMEREPLNPQMVCCSCPMPLPQKCS